VVLYLDASTKVEAYLQSSFLVAIPSGNLRDLLKVVLPILLNELVDTGLMNEDVFLYGLTLIQILPGPLFNISAYLGGVIGGIVGVLISWTALFAPGVILICGVYPFWGCLSQYKWMQKALIGVNAGALGLIIAAFFFVVAKCDISIYCLWYLCLLLGDIFWIWNTNSHHNFRSIWLNIKCFS